MRSSIAGLSCVLAAACANDPTFGETSAGLYSTGHPPFWTAWTTDGAAAIENGDGFATRGLRCRGDYCDELRLLGVDSRRAQTASWWTDGFSEEGQNYRICDGDAFVTGLRCSGDYCDSVALRCSELEGATRRDCYWTTGLSEESGGEVILPEGVYVAGASCNGRYCDSVSLYACHAGEPAPLDVAKLAAQFAPRLRFDQDTTTGSGAQSKCFPGDPGVYLAQRGQGASAISLCNQDPASLPSVPTYYVASRIGSDALVVRYWFFYAWQSTCFGGLGAHAGDWESMTVLVVGGELRRVAFWQHGGWYSREPGGLELVDGTHPVGYVGKNSHGTYHDDGGSGGCLYFEDYRNPGGNDFHLDTWHTLSPMWRGEGAAPWMNCYGSGCFDGVTHPIDQSGDVRYLGGCAKDGCGKSSIGDTIPFVDDPTGSDYTTITAQHSGKALDVPGASTANGVGITQYTNWHVDNQRWLLEGTGDGYVTLRARHSGKCMDVSGASQAAGAAVIQWPCNGGANQRFRLLSYGDGRYAVQVKHSGQCLDIAGWATGDGGALLQWPCTWGANQTFSFGP